jgi:hypothetical protein
MKYLECAYAGSVPIGFPAATLSQAARESFMISECRTADLRRAVAMPADEMEAVAAAYRSAMRVARDASTLDAALDRQIDAAL